MKKETTTYFSQENLGEILVDLNVINELKLKKIINLKVKTKINCMLCKNLQPDILQASEVGGCKNQCI